MGPRGKGKLVKRNAQPSPRGKGRLLKFGVGAHADGNNMCSLTWEYEPEEVRPGRNRLRARRPTPKAVPVTRASGPQVTWRRPGIPNIRRETT